MGTPTRRSDPIENLNSYVMVHAGIDRHERLIDIEWIRDVINAARDVAGSFDEAATDKAIDQLRRVLRR